MRTCELYLAWPGAMPHGRGVWITLYQMCTLYNIRDLVEAGVGTLCHWERHLGHARIRGVSLKRI